MPVPQLLALSGIGVPPFSVRGATMTLEPIPQAAQLRRTINGALVDVSQPRFRKYLATIRGDDQQAPACDGVWPGRGTEVQCLAELSVAGTVEEPTEETTEPPFGRPHVPGSVKHESGFTFYRLLLTMRVTHFSIDRDEWGAATSWTLMLEEE